MKVLRGRVKQVNTAKRRTQKVQPSSNTSFYSVVLQREYPVLEHVSIWIDCYSKCQI